MSKSVVLKFGPGETVWSVGWDVVDAGCPVCEGGARVTSRHSRTGDDVTFICETCLGKGAAKRGLVVVGPGKIAKASVSVDEGGNKTETYQIRIHNKEGYRRIHHGDPFWTPEQAQAAIDKLNREEANRGD